MVEMIDKFTKKQGGKIYGWSGSGSLYQYSVQQPNSRKGTLAFQELDETYVYIYVTQAPQDFSMTVRTLNMMARVANQPD